MISRSNNFDFLRLVFASLVIITHSYALSGATQGDPLSQLTNSQMEFSYLGVHGFFIISGYLIFKSLLRCKGLLDYYWKRLLRLFPALIVVLLITVLLAPAVYESSVPYLQNKSVYTYIPQNLTLFFRQKGIDGVFENNPYKHSINGSLWTICYEFSMYVMVSLLFFIRKKAFIKTVVILLFVSSYVLSIYYPYFLYGLFHKLALGTNHFYNLMCFFAGGMVLTYLNASKRTENILIITSFIILIISLYLNVFKYTCYITLPLLVILIGERSTRYLNKVGEVIGDTSYGIYIYSFPIQQALMYFFKFDTVMLFIFSLPLSILLGYISWHLIEKKALGYKDLFAKKAIQ
ncbi:Peptidoglycan/LPS O-acetylase OafA/YrhL, contains acyltransferase and SGNH-hydrolase domains [Chryseobacterium rhizoplanae]|uniref:Peptidoglycan/LPS O-acetylase OafA/YrhL, contains acyltransferase and SGNH-hydrolase domains n=1 Tax=Chryseobacterium rhizoplanae TaxID=1609531 RepID=A0A521D273_9FLAO|nr:acyltransferase [Chryseobacterium rhizoplanae]SMO65111.1 Peptidoglycan/LPS O-acetylase OafA/YrhL, contains acyltransferase and SGNH-hydrolase domains [Chryseobacterium rhizoplanae]